MRLVPGGPAREPVLFFLAAEHQELLNEKELAGPADLAIEVISDDSVSRDRADKPNPLAALAEIAGFEQVIEALRKST